MCVKEEKKKENTSILLFFSSHKFVEDIDETKKSVDAQEAKIDEIAEVRNKIAL